MLPDKTRNFTTLPTGKPSAERRRLDSWKEVAAFFGRDERTVSRWEKDLGLPVHRLPGTRGRVYAFTDELSAWQRTPEHAQATATSNDSETQPEPSPAKPQSGSPRLTVMPGRPSSEISGPIRERPKGWFAPPFSFAWKIAALALVIVLGLAALSLGALYRYPNAKSIAVLPFANGGSDASADYLSDGITESLIDNLTHLPQLEVRSRNSAFRYKGKDVDVRKIGNELGVSILVTGRVVARGDAIEVNAELTDVRDNTEMWAQHYRGKNTGILLLQQQIAGDIAEKLRSKLSPAEKQQVTRLGTENPEAYQLYLKGRFAWNKRTYPDLEAAVSYFDQAIAKDPGYALAYSGLADAYSVIPIFRGDASENFSKSNAAARRALELDPSLAHPHAVLGVNESQYEWDFAGGEAEFKKALELDPNDATAHQWYAEVLDRIGGQQQKALDEINLAHRLDPLSSVITRVLAGTLVTARRHDEAIAICQKLAHDDPTFAIAHDCLAYAYWAKRMYPEVVEEWKAYGQLTGNPEEAEFAEALDQGFRSGGWKGAMTRAIEERRAGVQSGHVSPVELAFYYANLGEKDKAFAWLDAAYQEHDWMLIGLNTYFQLDSIRSDPRFAELLRKVGLPQ